MKWFLGIIISSLTLGFPNNIAKINKLKSEAQKSYLSGDYQSAIEHYGILIDSFDVSEEKILMNYANAAFLLIQKRNLPTQGVDGPANSGPNLSGEQSEAYQQLAQSTYTGLAQSASSDIQSMAFNQLGVMVFQSAPPPKPQTDVLRQAQGLFRSALKTDQNNYQARFNYELTTKMLKQEEERQQNQDKENDQEQDKKNDQEQQDQEQKKEQQQDQEQQDQNQSGEDEPQDQPDQEENTENQEGDPKEPQEQQPDEQQGEQDAEQEPLNASPEKMDELKISEETARMILEAMKNSEVQYIQQNQRKSGKKPDSEKPDW